MTIEIGFKYAVKRKGSYGREYWQEYEVVGSRYGNAEGYCCHDFKTRDDVLSLRKYVQIIDLPHKDRISYQLSIDWYSLKELRDKLEEDAKLLPEYRKYRIL